jgi:ABC-type lipoprotein release transport system permease subunit
MNEVMNLPKEISVLGIVFLTIATLIIAICGSFILSRRAMSVPVAESFRYE